MDLNSTAPVAPPMQAGVSARWLWVVLAALGVCMAALAGAWMLLPGFGSAQAAAPNVTAAQQKLNPGERGAAEVAQGIQAPAQLDRSAGAANHVTSMSATGSGVGLVVAGSAVRLNAK